MSPLAVLSKDQTRAPFYVQTGNMYQNPHGVPHAEIRSMERELPAEIVAQAVYGMYVEDSGLVFNNRLLQGLFYGEQFRTECWEVEDVAERIRPMGDPYGTPWKRKFVVGADLARRNDFTVVMGFDVTYVPRGPAQMVWYQRLNRVSWETIYAAVAYAAVRFHAEVLVDNTGMGGDVVEDELGARFYCVKCDVTIPYSLTGGSLMCPACRRLGERFEVAGFNFSGKRKEQLVTRLQNALSYGDGWWEEMGLLKMPRIEQVVNEMTFYRLDDKKLETDCVMALGLVAQVLEFEETGGAVGSIHGG